MRIRTHCLAVALLCSVGCLVHAADRVGAYKWVDENGVTHYGDSVPAQYAKRETSVLNKQGMEVARTEAQKSAEEQAKDAQEKETMVRQKQHDSFLLTTYTSVKDIEALRDERLEQISGQRRAAEAYVETLHSRLSTLQSRALNFRPYNDKPAARRMPDDLAEDLMRTLNEMRSQRTALAAKDAEENALRAQFQSDIDRYRDLRSIRSNR
ncbi:MAG: DUF4124 domain-containing protein [Gammaproteobacteria bacterium]